MNNHGDIIHILLSTRLCAHCVLPNHSRKISTEIQMSRITSRSSNFQRFSRPQNPPLNPTPCSKLAPFDVMPKLRIFLFTAAFFVSLVGQIEKGAALGSTSLFNHTCCWVPARPTNGTQRVCWQAGHSICKSTQKLHLASNTHKT